MNKRTLVKLVCYFIGFILPILAMYNCTGFNAGNGTVTDCVIDAPFIREYANFYFGWITISSFMFFIPVIIYIVGVHQRLTSR